VGETENRPSIDKSTEPDYIKAKTGKTPADFKELVEKKGLLRPGVKAMEIVTWLKEGFGLGHGHAMAIVHALKEADSPPVSVDERIDDHFSGGRSGWRATYDNLLKKVGKFGEGVSISPTDTYLSILKGGKKFAVVQATSNRLDIGIKLKGVRAKGRFEDSGPWKGMVTHRVRISDPKQIDAELFTWLKQAYDKA